MRHMHHKISCTYEGKWNTIREVRLPLCDSPTRSHNLIVVPPRCASHYGLILAGIAKMRLWKLRLHPEDVFPSNVICTRVFSSASLWCRDSDRACITLCFSQQTQMGAAGGGRWSSREGASATDQVWQEHLHLSACGLCPWLKLSLVSRGECRGAVSRRHRLVWKISAISVSASGLMRTRGAEPGKGCSFVWVPISIKQQ